MAFGRLVELVVAPNGSTTGTVISDLFITFEIERTCMVEKNIAKFKIYNATEQTRKTILVQNSTIRFLAGYQDENNLSLIFGGIIADTFSHKDGENWVTEITAIDFGTAMGQGITSQNVNISFRAGTLLSEVINTVVTTLMFNPVGGSLSPFVINGIENVSGIKLNNGFKYTGSLSGVLKKITEICLAQNPSIGVFVDNANNNGDIFFYKIGVQDTTFGIVNLTPQSGMILGATEHVDKKNQASYAESDKIETTSLLNPKLRPRTIVNVNGFGVRGAYAIRRVVHIGDNFGGDFFSKLELEAVSGEKPSD
jgi:hypothetical protein